MTCIVGLVHEGRVWLGGDSCGSNGYTDLTIKAPKVFRRGPYVMGYTTSFRMGQLLECWPKLPEPHPKADRKGLHQFMILSFVDWMRTAFEDGGWLKKNDGREQGGKFLVGLRGRIFCVESDLSVLERAEGYDAVGCGAAFALGAMSVLRTKPRTRLRAALQAAETHGSGVRPPFRIISVGKR